MLKPAEIQMRKMTTPESVLPAMTQFDGLHLRKYAHVHEQRAIAD